MKQISGISVAIGAAIVIGASGFAANGAVAQGSSGGLEEVTVTARRRDESLLDVPISITSLSADQLDQYNLQDMEELSRMTPGMFYSDWGGTGRQDRGNSQFVVRGLALNSFQSLSDAALLFIDGVPSITGNLPGSMDIERIEVLKGPQTATFGRNTFSGAISVTTRDPADTFGGRAVLELANYNSSQVGLSLEGPLVEDKVFGRVSFEQRTEGAQYNNAVNGQPLGGQSTTSIWGSLKFVPSDNLQIRLVANYFEFDDDWGAQVRLGVPFNNCDPGNTGSNTWFCGTVPKVTEADTSFLGIDRRWLDNTRPFFQVDVNDGEPGLVAENSHASAQIAYEFGNGWVLESTTGFDSVTQGNIASEWYSPDNIHAFIAVPGVRQEQSWIYIHPGESENLSQELRVSNAGDERLRWSVGVNYVRFETVGGTNGDVPFPIPALGWSPTTALQLPGGKREAETTSVFGSAYYDLTPNLELGIEARYQKDEIVEIGRFWAATPNAPLSGDWTAFTPRVSLSYKPNDDMTIFGVYAQGQRPGAFNSNLQPGGAFSDACLAEVFRQTGGQLEADQEQIDTLDVGVKARFAEGRGNVQATVYTGTLTDQQDSQTVGIVEPGCTFISTIISNLGESDIQGIEVDVTYQLTDALTATAAFSYNDVELVKASPLTSSAYAFPAPVIGNALPRTPNTQGFAGLDYRGTLRNGMGWYVGGEYLYIGRKYVTIANLAEVPDQQLVNARIGLEKDAWRIELWGKNLFDNDSPDLANPSVDYDLFGTGQGTINRAVTIGLPKKRMFGVRMNYDF